MKLCGFEVGLDQPFFLIAGPCVVESEQLQMDVAGPLKEMTAALGVPFIFKSSFDKANRSSGTSFRGPGLERGLEILAKVRRELKVPILTDVHDEAQIAAVAAVVDVLQTPAFLCRQTDFIRAVAQSGKPVNIKKGQFLAPQDMKNVIAKARAAAREKGLPEDSFMACERGVSFGYNNLVSDMRSLAIMRDTGAPVVFDATHSVQLPGGQGTSSGGQREFVPVLSRAAIAVGVAGLFMETHPDPGTCIERRPQCRAAETHEGAAGATGGARPSRQAAAAAGKRLLLLRPHHDRTRLRHRRDEHLRPRAVQALHGRGAGQGQGLWR
jgi:2-dehydro-3-deoxyphosphooctonate aldolase (KDO 8-P synthase)